MNALLNVALPVFGIILAGYLVGRLRLLGPQGSQVLNGLRSTSPCRRCWSAR
jgi:predicted permease